MAILQISLTYIQPTPYFPSLFFLFSSSSSSSFSWCRFSSSKATMLRLPRHPPLHLSTHSSMHRYIYTHTEFIYPRINLFVKHITLNVLLEKLQKKWKAPAARKVSDVFFSFFCPQKSKIGKREWMLEGLMIKNEKRLCAWSMKFKHIKGRAFMTYLQIKFFFPRTDERERWLIQWIKLYINSLFIRSFKYSVL